jgi:uncharacterized protein (DUF362 family)
MNPEELLHKLKRFLVKMTISDEQTYVSGMPLYRLLDPVPWKEETYIGKAADYETDLEPLISAGFAALGVSAGMIRGKHIVLKPNLVETSESRSYFTNTHPKFMLGTILALQRLGAGKVTIAEGAGHRRDSMILLEQSGLIEVIKATGAAFVDLNYADCTVVPNKGGTTKAAHYRVPKILGEADWVISMAKMKTHHWAGVTLALKNLFGTIPGIYYGWPKNVLHHMGLRRSIYDIASTIEADFAMVEGIIGMDGDGPILGDPKPAGVFVMGKNLPAVDATCCRIMGIDPAWINYLAASPYFLGPIDEEHITQKGAAIDAVKTEFTLLEHIDAHLGLLKLRRAKTVESNAPRGEIKTTGG